MSQFEALAILQFTCLVAIFTGVCKLTLNQSILLSAIISIAVMRMGIANTNRQSDRGGSRYIHRIYDSTLSTNYSVPSIWNTHPYNY